MIDTSLSPADVPVGMPLPWSIVDGQGRLLLHKGYVIARQITVASLFAQCSCQIGTDKDVEPDSPEDSDTTSDVGCPIDAWYELVEPLEYCLSQPYLLADFSVSIMDIAIHLQRTVAEDADLALGFILLTRPILPVVKQALANAIICEIVGLGMRMSASARRSMIAAALTVGMMDLADPADDREASQSQSASGRIIEHLRHLDVTDADWLNIVSQYHEIESDHGYSLDLTLDQAVLETRMLQLAGSYTRSLCPLNTESSNTQQFMMSYQVLRDIFMESGRGGDPVLGGYFIKALGSYPVGCRVELSNGETGVVIRRTGNLNSPIVMVLANAYQQKLKIPIKRDTSLKPYRISGIITPENAGPLDPHLLWGYLPFKSYGKSQTDG